MKSVIIELKRKVLDQTTELAVVQHLERHFKIIDDSKDKYEILRFITIDGEDLQIDLNGINIELRSISKPHICVGIYKLFIHAVDVTL